VVFRIHGSIAVSVFVVEVGAYSDRYISAIFTTRELAEAYVRETVKNSWERTFIQHNRITMPSLRQSIPSMPRDSLPFKEWRAAVEELTGNWNEFGDVDEYDLWDQLPLVSTTAEVPA